MAISGGTLYGNFPLTNQTWRPELIKGDHDRTSVETLVPDPSLPTVYTDPVDVRKAVVIPQGRFVSVGRSIGYGAYTDTSGIYDSMITSATAGAYGSTRQRMRWTDTGVSLLTLCNGRDTAPLGISENRIFKAWDEHFMNKPVKFAKGVTVGVPYSNTIHGVYGQIESGDRLAPFYGTATTAGINPYYVGLPVKYIPRATYSFHNATSTGTHSLTSCTFPGLVPRIIMAWNGTTVVASATNVTAAAGLSYSSQLGQWLVTFGSNVTDFVYSYGMDPEQLAGECVRVENLRDLMDHNSWLQWVVDNDTPPPALYRVPTTGETRETPSTVTAGSVYQTKYYPIDPMQPIRIYISGVITDNGTSRATTTTSDVDGTALGAGYELLLTANQLTMDYTMGQYYMVNYLTGYIWLSSNITTVSAISVSYYAETKYGYGRAFGAGQRNLTDDVTGWNDSTAAITTAGLATMPYTGGVPAYLNLAGWSIVGELRAIIF